jgi:hypothetical protein
VELHREPQEGSVARIRDRAAGHRKNVRAHARLGEQSRKPALGLRADLAIGARRGVAHRDEREGPLREGDLPFPQEARDGARVAAEVDGRDDDDAGVPREIGAGGDTGVEHGGEPATIADALGDALGDRRALAEPALEDDQDRVHRSYVAAYRVPARIERAEWLTACFDNEAHEERDARR